MGNCMRPQSKLPLTRPVREDSHESQSKKKEKLTVQFRASGSSSDSSAGSSWYVSRTSDGSSSNASATSTQTRLKLQNDLKQSKGIRNSKHATEVKSRWEQINELIAMANTLDLAFLFDATGSMQPHMDSVKSWIAEIAQGIATEHPQCSMRVAFAVYRDYTDKESCKSCDFTTSFNGSGTEFMKALSCVPATGGSDTAEDVFSGLERIAVLSWKAANRIVFHIADAPCHGTQFHCPSVGDSFPKGDKLGRNIITLLQNLRDRTSLSCYYFLHINSSTKKMLEEFRLAGEKPGDEWIHEDDLDMKNKADVPSKIVKVCSNSISKTLSGVATGSTKLKSSKAIPCTVQPDLPDWALIISEEGKQYKYKWYDNLEELLSKLSSQRALDLELMDSVRVQIAPLPFTAEGAIRWPYYAQLELEKGLCSPMVIKRFKIFPGEDTKKVHAKERYLEQMEVQSVAAQMAHQFNLSTQGISGVKQVKFTQVTTVEMGGTGDSTKFYNMEMELSGKWIRYSNNAGYVNTGAYAATLQAFSHWTHEHSKGLLMVTDLQGVQIGGGLNNEDYEFQLCDPAIHCMDLTRFTRTNLGERGFQLFYKSHKCNNVCKELNLSASKIGEIMEDKRIGSK